MNTEVPQLDLMTFLRKGMAAPLLVVAVLAMMVVPLPPFALDLFFTLNIAISLIVLLAAIYALRPLDFSAFPTILLAATILRLGLNIASTRIVLMEGHTGTAAAGAVIESFGEFVIGGNYAVGLVVFAILVIINFVVITKGAGRVSEVSARFTLDAMPGKQMAVDADLNAGILTQEEASRRRQEISQEADFYGSMDGASKFVRGDAIAGILILFINILGGLSIGIAQHNLAFSEAVHNYTLLTIGDGLVAQLPSLLLSIATAVIVTRVSTSQDMGSQISEQMFSDPRALVVTAGILGGLGVIPGMPNVVFLLLATACGIGAWVVIDKQKAAALAPATVEPKKSKSENPELSWEDVKAVDVLGMEVGYKLIPLVDQNQEGSILSRIKGVRRKLSETLGFLVQPVHIRDNLDLAPNQYRFLIHGVPEANGEVYPERELAINPANTPPQIQGQRTVDPAFGMDAVWIDPSQRSHAQMQGYTVVDASTVIATHLNKVLADHAADLLGHDEAEQLFEKLSKRSPKLVENLVPKTISMSTAVKVMQNLLAEGIPVRDMRGIAEAMADTAVVSQDADTLTAAVRVALRRLIVQQISSLDGDLPVLTLAPELEQLLLQSYNNNGGQGLTLEPGLADRITQSLTETCQRQDVNGQPSVLLTASELRPWLARMFRSSIPSLKVLAYSELPRNRQIKVIASIGAQNQTAGLAHSPA